MAKRAKKTGTKSVKRAGKKAVKKAIKKIRRNPRAGLKLAANQRLMRHEEPAGDGADVATLTAAQMLAVEKHVEKHMGAFDQVLHEIVSERIHLDLLPSPATKKRPFHVYVTMGMSALPMTIPDGQEAPPRAELVLVLPGSWKTDQKAFAAKGERWWWPIRGLKDCAKLPCTYDTFLSYGHTVGSNEEGTMAPGCPFVSWLVVPVLSFGDHVHELKSKKWSEGAVQFMQIIPLTKAELDFKLEHGLDALFDKLEASGVDPVDLCDPKRPSAV